MAQLSLVDFLSGLTERLGTLSKDEIVERLLARAQELHPRERWSFLGLFGPDRPPAVKPWAPDEAKGFLQAIDELAERVRAYAFSEEGGWPDEFDPDDELDNSWAEEMDALFADARSAYQVGQFDLAREAYRGLLNLLDEATEEGMLPVEEPEELLDVDVEEERLRYLRCVYHTEPSETRTTALHAEFQQLPSPGTRYGLRALRDVDPNPLPDFADFGAVWIEHLRALGADAAAAELLVEAAELFQGSDGLRGLARQRGTAQPRLYLAWVNALCAAGAWPAAGEAAREALSAVPKHLVIRADLADRLAEAGVKLGEEEWCAAGKTEGFLAQPCLTRLMDLLDGASTPEARGQCVDRALARCDELASGAKRPPLLFLVGQSDLAVTVAESGLKLRALLLGGDYAAVANALQDSDANGRLGPEDPASLAVPFFLLARQGTATALGPNLKSLWEDATAEDPFSGFEQEDADGEPVGDRFARAVEATLRQLAPAETAREEYFTLAVRVAKARAGTVVANQRRHEYAEAARLLAAAAEVYCGTGRPAAGQALLADTLARFPRHSAFRNTLRQAAARAGIPAR